MTHIARIATRALRETRCVFADVLANFAGVC
jgi:hypothetical protein